MGINSQSSSELSRGKRRRGASFPEESSSPTIVAASEPKKQVAKIPRGGRRGAALLRAAGVTDPASKSIAIASPPRIAPRSRTAGKRKASALELSPKKDPLEKQRLPAKLANLEEIFAAVHTVYDMLRRRGKRTTFGNMKAAVEETSRRRFLESHLSQLQVLLPEVIRLDTFSLPVAAHSTRTAPNLVLTMAVTGDQPAVLRAQLHTRLARHLLDSYASFLRTTAAELRAAGDTEGASKADAEAKTAMEGPLETFRAPYPDAVPDVDMVSAARVVSPQPKDMVACVTASASLGGAASSDGHGQATSAAVPVPRRLSFTQADDTSFMVTMPAELRRRSLDGIISVDSLRVLEDNEREYRRFSSQEANDARDKRAALGALPTTFARLRRIFGPRGPSAMKMDDVVKRIKGGGAELTPAVEIVAQLRCLAEHAPEFVEIKPWGACGTPAVWINRKCEWNEVAAKLKAVAAARRESVPGPGAVV